MTLARVNDLDIEKLDYILELAILTHDETISSADESIKKDVIVRLIDDALILQYAIKQNFNVSNEEVEESFLNTLLDLNSRYDFSDFLIENNITENNLMKRVKNQLIIHKFLNEFFRNIIIVDDQKLIDLFHENKECFESEDTVRISHILIEHFNENAEEKIRMMKEMIKNPNDFFKAVNSCSECPTCCQSGDLGYYTKGQLIPELDEVVFTLKLNEISEPIKSKFGWHLILITDKRCKSNTCFEDIKVALKQHLIEIEVELKTIQLLRELKEQANIKIFVDF